MKLELVAKRFLELAQAAPRRAGRQTRRAGPQPAARVWTPRTTGLGARALAILAAGLLAAAPSGAQTTGATKKAQALPRSDFYPDCPFLVAAPSVLAVFNVRRWRDMLAAAREPLPHEAAATNFRRESIIIVTLPRSPNPVADATLSGRRTERFEPKTGTLTLWFDVRNEPVGQGGNADSGTLGRRSCVIAWTEARPDLEQVIARTGDGTYIAGARVAPRPKKKSPAEKS